MKNLEQPTGDGGTAGVAVLKPESAGSLVISDTSQRQNIEPKRSGTADHDVASPFDFPERILESEPSKRVLDTKQGDLAGTAFNLAAEAVARGEKVLFLSEDPEKRRAVAEASVKAGLSEIVLTLDGPINTRSVIEELRRTLQRGPPSTIEVYEPTKQLAALDKRLGDHAHALGSEIRNTRFNGYEALSAVVGPGASGTNSIDFSSLSFREWNRSEFERAVKTASELDDCMRIGGYPGSNPWRGAALSVEASPGAQEKLQLTLQKLCEVGREIATFLSKLGFDPKVSENDADRILQSLKIIDGLETDSGAALKGLNLRATATWIRDRDDIIDGLETQLQLSECGRKLDGRVDFDKLRRVDLQEVSRAVATYQGKNAFSRVFDTDYSKALKSLEKVAPMPDRVEDVAKVVGHLEVLQKMLFRADELTERWERIFPEESNGPTDDLTLWRRRAQLSYAVMELFQVGDALGDADSKTLLGHLRKPEDLYTNSVKLQEMCSLVTEYKKLRLEAFNELGVGEKEQEVGFFSKTFTDQEKRFQSMCGGTESWLAWQRFVTVAERAKADGLEAIVQQVEEGRIVRPVIAAELKQAWFKSLAEEFIATRPGAPVQGSEQSEIVRRLLEADAQVREENAVGVARKHWDESPRYIVGGQSSALYRLISDEKSAPSIEEIFEKAPRAMQQAKPLLVSDVCTAGKISPGSPLTFDLVVLDEGVNVPADHPLRVRANVGRVVELTSEPTAANLGGGESAKSAGTAEVDLPRGDWRLKSASTAATKDQFQSLLRKILESDLKLTVHTDVKTPKGTIDLAVYDPVKPEKYTMGILLDGVNYRSGHSAIEREKGREEACVERSFLPPRREWIIDWYRNPEVSKREFVAAIQREIRQPFPLPAPLSHREIPREPLQPEHVNLFKPYEKATLDLSLLRVLQRSQGDLRPSEVADALAKIVKQEGPIHRDELAQRFLQCCGVRTLTEDMHLQIVEGEQAALKQKKLLVRNDCLYSPAAEQTIYPRSRGDLSGTLARFERIPAEELEAAICLVVKRSYGISRTELPAQLFKAFGYKGVPFGADAIVERELGELVGAKVLSENKSVLALGEKCRLI